MAEGVDYSFQVPSAAGLAAAGKRFAGRYVGPGSGKFVTPAERDALFAAGLDIFLNVEGSAGDAAGGWSVGVNHAQLALAHARRLGVPDHVAFYFAIDYDVIKGGWDAPKAYLQGAASVVGLGRVGVYGERDVMAWAERDGVAAWFFQTYAWSAGQWFAGNHVEQYQNHVDLAGGNVDLCRSRTTNFGQWRADGSNPGQIFPPSTQQGDQDMILIVQEGSGATYTFNGVFRQYQGDPAVVALLGQAGVRQIGVPDITQFGVEFSREEWFAMKDAILAGNGGGAPGGGGPSHAELAQAALRGPSAPNVNRAFT